MTSADWPAGTPASHSASIKNPFTMSNIDRPLHPAAPEARFFNPGSQPLGPHPRKNGGTCGNGGACRDRTDDLKLAKLALSQLS